MNNEQQGECIGVISVFLSGDTLRIGFPNPKRDWDQDWREVPLTSNGAMLMGSLRSWVKRMKYEREVEAREVVQMAKMANNKNVPLPPRPLPIQPFVPQPDEFLVVRDLIHIDPIHEIPLVDRELRLGIERAMLRMAQADRGR